MVCVIQVLWQVYSDRMGGNPPKLVDLMFVGDRTNQVPSIQDRRRPGTGTEVLLFAGFTGTTTTRKLYYCWVGALISILLRYY